jgi:cytochrome c oxidase subunit 1
MLYALSFLFVFCVGGLTGIFLASPSPDVHLHDTYFVIAHFHYTMVGGALMAFMAAIHYWFPKFFGKMYEEKLAKTACALINIGFNVTFFPQFFLGTQGMPRRYYDYPAEFTFLNQVSTVGSWIIFLGFILSAINLWKALRHGRPALDNPWGGATLEWKSPSPPPHDNFLVQPVVTTGPYEYDGIEYIGNVSNGSTR